MFWYPTAKEAFTFHRAISLHFVFVTLAKVFSWLSWHQFINTHIYEWISAQNRCVYKLSCFNPGRWRKANIAERERERDPPSAVCKERMKWQTCQAMQRRLPNVFHTLPGASAENRAGRTMRKGGRKQNKNTCVEPLWSFMLIQFDFLLAILLAQGGADASDGLRTEKRLHVHINQSTVTVSATKPTLSLILV